MSTAGSSQSGQIPLLERLGTLLFATSYPVERSAIAFRLVAALPLVLVIFASKNRLPYWELAIGAVGVMFVATVWLSYAYRTRLISPARLALVGSSVDTLLLLLVSNLAIRASADIRSTSEMWLIFPLVIRAFTYRARSIAGISYTVLLTAWYASHILAFFDSSDRAFTELPIRATFFVLMGGMAAVLSSSLRQQGSSEC